MKLGLSCFGRPRLREVKIICANPRFTAASLLLLCAAVLMPVPANGVGSFGITRSGTNVQIQWSGSSALLQSTTNLAGPWISLSNATSPYLVAPVGKAMFYRLQGKLGESLYVAPEYTSLIGNPLSSCGCTSPENPNSSATPGNPQDNAMGNVYLQTGELVQSAVDFSIPGVGFDWRLERHYRSGMVYNGPLGQGWDFNQNGRLVVQLNGDVKRVDGRGRTDLYLLLSNGTYTPPSGFYTRLTRNGDGSFVERDRHGTQSFYSAADSFGIARVTQISDRHSNSMTFLYNTNGQLSSVTDTLGRSISYLYNTNGRLVQVADFIGRTVSYGYDASGNLVSATGPAVVGTPNGNDFPGGKTTLYTYDANHQLLTVTAPNEAAVGGPPFLAAQYDSSSGRLTSLRVGGTNGTGIAAGGTITYSYANLSQAAPGDVTTAVFQTTVTNRNGNVTRYQFNQLGNVLGSVQFTRGVRAGDPAGYTNTYAYNADGETIQHVYPELNSGQFTYDSTNPDRFQQGNLLQTLHLPGPRGGDQASLITSSTYETNFNFVATRTDARGNVTTYTYDANGDCTHITHSIPSVLEDFTYNVRGQPTSHKLPDNGSGWRRLDTTSYYTSGPQTGYLQNRVVDSGGFNLTNHFDPDAVGNMTNTIDARGYNSIFIVNVLNQIVRTFSRAVTTSSGPVRYRTDYYYDANNNITNLAVQNIADTGAIVAGFPTITTATVYDILNDRVRRSQTQDPTHTVTSTNAYDADQNLVLAAGGEAVNGDQPNNVVATRYDERDLRFQQIRAPSDPGHSTTQYNYDGNRHRINTIQGTEDGLNPRITTVNYDGFDRPFSRLDAMGNVTATHYDANGNATNQTGFGELVDVPGSAGNTNLASTTYSYDKMDRLVMSDAAFFDTTTHTNIRTGHAITQTIYSDNSQVLTHFDANTNATTIIYDTANRPSVITDAKGNTTTTTYDSNNNITMVVETDLSDSGQPTQTFTTTYTYDNLDRLVETVNNTGDTEFDTYDSRNNRLSHVNENGNLERFGYDGLNRRLFTSRYLSGTTAVVLQQSWDADSRLVSQTDGNTNTTTYVYDNLNRLSTKVFADGTRYTNVYDVHNNRVSFTDENGTTVANTYDLLNRLQTRFVAPAAGVVGPLAEGFKYDGLSRVVVATNSSSQVTRQYDSLSHLTRETQQAVPGGPVGTTTCSYDGVGNLLACSYPGGRTISSRYDNLDRTVTLSDGLSVLASNQYIGKWRLEHRLLGNGIILNVIYDSLRRIAEMQYTNPAASLLVDDRSFTYDGDGNKLTAASPTENYLYQFDALDRLTNSLDTVAFHSTSYSLDSANNRTQVTGLVGGGPYIRNPGADFEMNQYSTTPFSTNRYDHNGNLISAGSRVMSYDYLNQLIVFSNYPSTQPVSFKYDCFRRRFQEVATNGLVTYYFYNGNNVIQENTSTGTNTYVWAPGLVSMTLGGQRYFPLCDDLGSAREATDIEGNIMESYRYSDFGQPSFFQGLLPLTNSVIGNSYLYRVQRYQPATQLGYTGMRYVDYSIGEFIGRGLIWFDQAGLGNGRTFKKNNPVVPGNGGQILYDEAPLAPTAPRDGVAPVTGPDAPKPQPTPAPNPQPAQAPQPAPPQPCYTCGGRSMAGSATGKSYWCSDAKQAAINLANSNCKAASLGCSGSCPSLETCENAAGNLTFVTIANGIFSDCQISVSYVCSCTCVQGPTIGPITPGEERQRRTEYIERKKLDPNWDPKNDPVIQGAEEEAEHMHSPHRPEDEITPQELEWEKFFRELEKDFENERAFEQWLRELERDY